MRGRWRTAHRAACCAAALTRQERAEPAHRQRFLLWMVADGQGVAGWVLHQIVAPHIAQFVAALCGAKAPQHPRKEAFEDSGFYPEWPIL